jgi:hypothetical protein
MGGGVKNAGTRSAPTPIPHFSHRVQVREKIPASENEHKRTVTNKIVVGQLKR